MEETKNKGNGSRFLLEMVRVIWFVLMNALT